MPCRLRARGFRHSDEAIALCMWLYHRFQVLFRDVEEMMLEWGGGLSPRTAGTRLG